MGRMVDGVARIRLALVLLLSGAIALLLPSLSASNGEAPSAVMLTAVAALVAAVVGRERHLTILASSPLARPMGRTDERPLFLAARVTDPARHPQRPRAPGLV
jgi:membrane associated rhomboid family serine protease